MSFSQEYPNITEALERLAIYFLISVAIALYGNWRYHEGVEQGRAQHVCEVLDEWEANKLPPACEPWISQKGTDNASNR